MFKESFGLILGVDEGDVGFVFLASTGAYMLSAPLWGWVIHKGYVGYILTISQFGTALVCFEFFFPDIFPSFENVWYMINPLVLQGLSRSILLGSLFLVLEKAAEREGIYFLIDSSCNTIRQLQLAEYSYCIFDQLFS